MIENNSFKIEDKISALNKIRQLAINVKREEVFINNLIGKVWLYKNQILDKSTDLEIVLGLILEADVYLYEYMKPERLLIFSHLNEKVFKELLIFIAEFIAPQSYINITHTATHKSYKLLFHDNNVFIQHPETVWSAEEPMEKNINA